MWYNLQSKDHEITTLIHLAESAVEHYGMNKLLECYQRKYFHESFLENFRKKANRPESLRLYIQTMAHIQYEPSYDPNVQNQRGHV